MRLNNKNEDKYKINNQDIGIISFIVLLAITFMLFKLNNHPVDQSKEVNNAISGDVSIKKTLEVQQKNRNEFSTLIKGTPEDFEKAGQIALSIQKDSTNQFEKDWYKKEYLKPENSRQLYDNLILANKSLEMTEGLNSQKFKERQQQINTSMQKIKEYKILLSVLDIKVETK